MNTWKTCAAAAAAAAELVAGNGARRGVFMTARRALLSSSLSSSSSSLAGGVRVSMRNVASPLLFTNPRVAFSSASAASAAPSTSAVSSSTSTPVESEIKVMAHFVGRMNYEDVLGLYPQAKRFTRPDCVLVPLDNDPHTPPASSSTSPSTSEYFNPMASYAFVFPYGAVVFFNAIDVLQQTFLNSLPEKPSRSLKDDYKIVVRPTSLTTDASSRDAMYKFLVDSLHVRQVDPYLVRIVAQVLAQTVGMEHYEQQTRVMLEEFLQLSNGMSREGRLVMEHPENLVRLLAQNNGILTAVLTQLRVLDRSEIVWRHGEYDQLWHGLRTEFDLQQRFDAMETKLKLLHDNHPLFLELLHQGKSMHLEKVIVALIAMEVILSVMFHSPLSSWLFGSS